MADHHVDRPGVQAQQCVELTGTNRSIGLILIHTQRSAEQHNKPVPISDMQKTRFEMQALQRTPAAVRRQASKTSLFFAGLVAMARGLHPIPSRTRP